MTVCTGRPSSRSAARVISPACPGVSSKRARCPSPSTSAWILVLSPPRERPSACSPFFWVRRRHVDGRERWSYPEKPLRNPHPGPALRTLEPTRQRPTTAQNAEIPSSTDRTLRADPAMDSPSGQSTEHPRRIDGYPLRCAPGLPLCRVASPRYVPIDHPATTSVPCLS